MMIPFMVLACSGRNQNSDEGNESKEPSQSVVDNSSENKPSSEEKPSSQESKPASSSATHEHMWSGIWSYDEDEHWHGCRMSGCDARSDVARHEMGEPQEVSPETLSGEDQYAYAKPKIQKCKTCSYYELVEGTNILPEIHFNFDDRDPDADFATKAKKNEISRPEVTGTYTLKNCPESMKQYEFENVAGTMKVRGNQTAGWRKKAFRIKFGQKINMMGLNNGGKFKKWVLLADAKDTCLIRSAAGLYLAREICKDQPQVWTCDYTPVTVYLNNHYWGYYYLGEQKEVKADGDVQRVRLPEVDSGYTGTDIGYCFELDHYAYEEPGEPAKGASGDPTFRMKYTPRMEQGRPSGPLATGQVDSYTMLSDITDGPTNEHIEAGYNGNARTSNSNQLSFIRARLEGLYQVLYYATQGQAKEINDNNEVINSSKSVQEVMEQHFDLGAWVDGVILNAVVVPPDLGYSSFYMSYDNSPTGAKKLRFDCPWDFDSNFGNRNNFYVDAQTDLYVNNTYNTWIYQLCKLSFFIDMVKVRWNQIRDAKVFENMITMMKQYFNDYDLEIHRNHYKWPENDAASMTYNNFDEIRDPYKNPSQYKEAEAETIKWCAKRVNYIETKWGNGSHTSIPTA